MGFAHAAVADLQAYASHWLEAAGGGVGAAAEEGGGTGAAVHTHNRCLKPSVSQSDSRVSTGINWGHAP